MDIAFLFVFLSIVAVASYVQTITGFALGLIIIGVVTIFDLAPIAFTAAVVSLLGLFNTLMAVRGHLRKVYWQAVRAVCIGLLPTMVIGVLLLNHLSASSSNILSIILGITIICGGVFLMLKPTPYAKVSSSTQFFLMGAVGGFFGGLYNAPAPPLVYQLYRQPFNLYIIRSTLLAILFIGNVGRVTFVSIQGGYTREIISLGLMALPVAAVATQLARSFPPALSDTVMRRVAFMLLILIGTSLTLSSL